MAKHYFTYDVTQKVCNPQPKKCFFECRLEDWPIRFFRVQSTRLADPFEPLNSSLAQSAEELLGGELLFFRPKSKYEYTVGRLSTC